MAYGFFFLVFFYVKRFVSFFFPLKQFVFNLCIVTLNATVMKSRLIHLWKIRKAQLIHHFPLCVSVLSDNTAQGLIHTFIKGFLLHWPCDLYSLSTYYTESHRYTFRYRTIRTETYKKKRQLSLLCNRKIAGVCISTERKETPLFHSVRIKSATSPGWPLSQCLEL